MKSPFSHPPARTPLGRSVTVAALVLAAAALTLLSGTTSANPPAFTDSPRPDSMLGASIPEGKYRYQFAWNGIPSAQSEVVISSEQDGERLYYRIQGTARTSKFADIFWRFRAQAVAVVDALSGRATRIRVAEQQNNRFKETETVFNYDSSEAHYTRWKKEKVRHKTIRLDGNTVDPASLALIVCRQPLEVGDSAAFTVLVGDDPYALEYQVTGRDRVSVAEQEFDALRVEPRFHKIMEKEEGKPPKVRHMTLWLSEAEPRIPLKMKSKTFIGYVTGELQQTEPAGGSEKDFIDTSFKKRANLRGTTGGVIPDA